MSLRKALLVGINAYPGSPLRGCINDVVQMKDLLQRFYGFTDDGIQCLLDEQATLAGVTTGLEWLAQGGSDADAVRVFHFSGHGTFIADTSGDEPDGRDECLVPYDYRTAGVLSDDALKVLYDRFPRSGNLTLVMDSCHSGSVQRDVAEDIAYRFIPVSYAEQVSIDTAARKFREDQVDFVVQELRPLRREEYPDEEWQREVRQLMKRFEKARFGDVRNREANVLLAGCRADQTAADAKIAGDYHGAFTYYLAEAIQDAGGQLSYRELAEQTSEKLGEAHYVQVPQLEYRSRRDQRAAFKPFV